MESRSVRRVEALDAQCAKLLPLARESMCKAVTSCNCGGLQHPHQAADPAIQQTERLQGVRVEGHVQRRLSSERFPRRVSSEASSDVHIYMFRKCSSQLRVAPNKIMTPSDDR